MLVLAKARLAAGRPRYSREARQAFGQMTTRPSRATPEAAAPSESPVAPILATATARDGSGGGSQQIRVDLDPTRLRRADGRRRRPRRERECGGYQLVPRTPGTPEAQPASRAQAALPGQRAQGAQPTQRVQAEAAAPRAQAAPHVQRAQPPRRAPGAQPGPLIPATQPGPREPGEPSTPRATTAQPAQRSQMAQPGPQERAAPLAQGAPLVQGLAEAPPTTPAARGHCCPAFATASLKHHSPSPAPSLPTDTFGFRARPRARPAARRRSQLPGRPLSPVLEEEAGWDNSPPLTASPMRDPHLPPSPPLLGDQAPPCPAASGEPAREPSVPDRDWTLRSLSGRCWTGCRCWPPT